MNSATRLVLRLIMFYRDSISPAFAPHCRFDPTCSAYAVEAFSRFSFARGLYLTVRRVLRCHPFHRGGHDPVPPRVDRVESLRSRPC